MSRTLSSSIQTLLAGTTHRVVHLLSFTAGATNYYFAEDQVVFQGNTYKPHLILESPIRYSQRLQLEPVQVRLQNIDLQTASLLKTQQTNLQGVEATVQRLFLPVNEAVILLRGRIGEVELDERTAGLTLEGDLDPTASRIPARKYSPACAWDFKDSNCGYVGGVDPNDPATGQPFAVCPKDFLSCQARGRSHRFSGFLHITRDLTEAIEGQAKTPEQDRTLSEALLP